MDTLLRHTLKETAVYWAPASNDGFGAKAYTTGVDVNVRWEQKTRIITNSKGVEMISEAEVFVLQDMVEEGRLWLGSIEDSVYDADPDNVSVAYVIRAFEKLPSLKSGQYVRKVFLGKGKI